ncbi:MAG: hypothetical protein LBF90_05045 [Prevotellaceae bacterium]|jgi:hypothetical protein|nr:hypothetical protein [Prevotellaceae bacterium]
MATRDYIPRKDSDFLTWINNFLSYLLANMNRLNVSAEVYDRLVALRDDYAQKLAVADNPATRTKLTVQAKTTARDALEKETRQTVNEYLTYNHLVTDEDRDGFGLPIHKSGRTPAPVAGNAPWVTAGAHGPRVVRIDFGESPTSAAKPEGQHCVELASVIAETRPPEVDDLIHSAVDTHTPLLLTFKESERGRTLWFAARWENTRGEKGPWSDIFSVIIP